jgi:hypothetical protein
MNQDISSYQPTDKLNNRLSRNFLSATAMLGHLCIARQSSWQVRVKQDGKGSRGIRIMPLMIVAGKP